MDLNLLYNNDEFYYDECNPECLPFEKSLDAALKNAKGKTIEELEKQWEEEDKEVRERAKDMENLKYDEANFDDEEEYSSGEEIPTCNPWRD